MKESEEKFKQFTKDPKGFFNSIIDLDTGKNVYCLPFFYRKQNNNGEFYKGLSELNVKMNFNPFTGDKFEYADVDNKTAQNDENGALGKLDGCINTFTGLKLNLIDPKPEQMHIIDIAKGLAYQAHFSGQTPKFYSIAQHSVFVVDLMIQDGFLKERRFDALLAGLLHDGSEFCLKDMVKPLKMFLPNFVVIEKRMQKVIYEKFGLDPELEKIVKPYDIIAQQKQFKAYSTRKNILYLSPEDAYTQFIARFNLYSEQLANI